MDVGQRLKAAWSLAAGEIGGPEHLTELLSRLALLFCGSWTIALIFSDWTRTPFFASVPLTLLILGGFALGVIDVAASVQTWIPGRRVAMLVPVSVGYLVIEHFIVFVSLVPFYSTDGMAFSHYSALLLLQGRNPYTENLLPALDFFHTPTFYVTPTESGGIVSRQTYPALSFLIYVPFAFAGLADLRFVSLAAHVVAVLVLYRVTPPPLRAFAPLALALPDQLEFTPGSVQDILWVPPLLLSMAYQDRRRLSGAFYGIACSIKPLPWLLAPFLLVHFWKRDGAAGNRHLAIAEFVGFAAGSFALINGPFILWNPSAWLSGVLDPLLGQNIPLGTGLSLLSQSAWLPVSREFYVVALAAIGSGLLLLEYLEYGKLKYLVWWLPGLLMFFSYRSLLNYFIYWYPMVFVSLAVWFREGMNRRTHAAIS